MLRTTAVCFLLYGTAVTNAQPDPPKLTAPAGWGGETITLPPGFAADMRLKGVEHIRFAPGMMQSASDTFFCYAFAFEIEPQPALTEAVVREEFLKYYRGLCTAVLDGGVPDVEPSKFTLKLQQVDVEGKPSKDKTAPRKRYTGTLDWVEPFATKKAQQLKLEIQTWSGQDRNYIFACVSPQARDAAIWKQLHQIRDDYLKRQPGSDPSAR